MDNKIVTLDEMAADINDRLELAANPAQNGGGGGSWEQDKALLTEAAETIARLEAALREIIDASNNTGIEMGTVGMRVAERVEDIARAVEASLRRLGTDHIDLYQMHRCDAALPNFDVVSSSAGSMYS